MIASLPMYHRPELADTNARYWALIRRRLQAAGVDSPTELSQDVDEVATWSDRSLVLSQTCGMPYRNDLHGRVTLICTPDYGLDGCDPGYYRSAVVVRRDESRTRVEDFASATFVYNQHHSQSGFGAAYQHVAPLGFWFASRFGSGSHVASAGAIADGRADIGVIDAVTWRLIQRYDPFASSLKVIDWTTPTPGLPYISRFGLDGATMFDAIAQAISDLEEDDRRSLGIDGLLCIPAEDYLRVENPPQEVIDGL